MSDSWTSRGLQPCRLLCLLDSPGKNNGVCCYALLHGIFLNQGPNPCLLHCRQILYLLRHQGSSNEVLIRVKGQIQFPAQSRTLPSCPLKGKNDVEGKPPSSWSSSLATKPPPTLQADLKPPRPIPASRPLHLLFRPGQPSPDLLIMQLLPTAGLF